ncbi:hypothetical protein JZM32_14385 [Acinetobacter pittii]|uniref:hypothetical protein n=1 Tax=Acinetobacter pittii TaxID=48296 RepID=UPI001981AA13|nr:hypothetical protein [Acinetobacter pittii]MBN6529189.1 hypothetical protein [Acinetobacter pittii]
MSNLLKEKNLREIYKKSRAIPISNFNLYFPFIIGIIFMILLIFSNISALESYAKIDSLISFLFSSLFSTLGFLIAGYTIFCTITPLDLQKKMIEYTDKTTGLIFFKRVHFTFIRVFIYFLLFSFLLFIIYLLKGININLSDYIVKPKNFNLLCKYINYLVLSFLATGTTFLFCELSSFIFNIYNSIASTLHWSITNQSDTEK